MNDTLDLLLVCISCWFYVHFLFICRLLLLRYVRCECDIVATKILRTDSKRTAEECQKYLRFFCLCRRIGVRTDRVLDRFSTVHLKTVHAMFLRSSWLEVTWVNSLQLFRCIRNVVVACTVWVQKTPTMICVFIFANYWTISKFFSIAAFSSKFAINLPFKGPTTPG